MFLILNYNISLLRRNEETKKWRFITFVNNEFIS